QTMWARPEGRAGNGKDGKPLDAYYGCGWQVRPVGEGKSNNWHTGYIAGTEALLVRRFDGLDWAVLFNTTSTEKDGLADLIDPKAHAAADEVKKWPDRALFVRYLK